MSAPVGTPTILPMPPGASLTPRQAERATCLALALSLTAGRSVPIQVVERIAVWLYSGERGD